MLTVDAFNAPPAEQQEDLQCEVILPPTFHVHDLCHSAASLLNGRPVADAYEPCHPKATGGGGAARSKSKFKDLPAANIATLCDMGFDQALATFQLEKSSGNVEAAMEAMLAMDPDELSATTALAEKEVTAESTAAAADEETAAAAAADEGADDSASAGGRLAFGSEEMVLWKSLRDGGEVEQDAVVGDLANWKGEASFALFSSRTLAAAQASLVASKGERAEVLLLNVLFPETAEEAAAALESDLDKRERIMAGVLEEVGDGEVFKGAMNQSLQMLQDDIDKDRKQEAADTMSGKKAKEEKKVTKKARTPSLLSFDPEDLHCTVGMLKQWLLDEYKKRCPPQPQPQPASASESKSAVADVAINEVAVDAIAVNEVAINEVRVRRYMGASRSFEGSVLLSDESKVSDTYLKTDSHVALELGAPIPTGGRAIKIQYTPKTAAASSAEGASGGGGIVAETSAEAARAAMGVCPVGRTPHAPSIAEIIVPAAMTVRGCIQLAKAAFGIVEEHWHLRSSVWGGDRGSAIDNLDANLGEVRINSNETLLLEAGDVVPRGQVEVEVFWRRPTYYGCKTEADVVEAFATKTVKAWVTAATKLVGRLDFGNMVCALSDDSAATAVDSQGIQALGDCIDNVELGVDARIVKLGTLRCKRLIDPYTLMNDAVPSMPEVRAHPELGAVLNDVGFPCGTAVRQIPLGRASLRQVGMVLCPPESTKMDPNLNLHSRMRLCIELAPAGAEAERLEAAAAAAAASMAAGAVPPSHAKKGPILLHVALRDLSRLSYFETQPFVFYPPHTEGSFREQLSVLAQIPPEFLRVSKYVPHSKWPKDRWDPILPWLPPGESEYSAAAHTAVLARTTAASAVAGALKAGKAGNRQKYKRSGGGGGGGRKGAGKGKRKQQHKKKSANKTPRPAKLNIAALLKHGTVLGVADLGNGEDDMSCAADRAHSVEKEWLHNHRELAKKNREEFNFIGSAASGGGGGGGGGGSSSSSASTRRAEPVLRIHVPTFLSEDEEEEDEEDEADEADEEGEQEGKEGKEGKEGNPKEMMDDTINNGDNAAADVAAAGVAAADVAAAHRNEQLRGDHVSELESHVVTDEQAAKVA